MIGCVTLTRHTFATMWVSAPVPITCKLTNIVKIEHPVGLWHGPSVPISLYFSIWLHLVAWLWGWSVVRKINDFEVLPCACTHNPLCFVLSLRLKMEYLQIQLPPLRNMRKWYDILIYWYLTRLDSYFNHILIVFQCISMYFILLQAAPVRWLLLPLAVKICRICTSPRPGKASMKRRARTFRGSVVFVLGMACFFRIFRRPKS